MGIEASEFSRRLQGRERRNMGGEEGQGEEKGAAAESHAYHLL